MFKITKYFATLFCKSSTLVLGLLSIILALSSNLLYNYSREAFRVCKEFGESINCPRVSNGWSSLEYKYMNIVVLLCFVLSGFCILPTYYLGKPRETRMCCKICDFCYHLCSAVALLVAGIVYFKSLGMVWSGLENYYKNDEQQRQEFRTEEDVAAGIFVLLNALMYGATCLVICWKINEK